MGEGEGDKGGKSRASRRLCKWLIVVGFGSDLRFFFSFLNSASCKCREKNVNCTCTGAMCDKMCPLILQLGN